ETIDESRKVIGRVNMLRHFMIGNISPDRSDIHAIVYPVIDSVKHSFPSYTSSFSNISPIVMNPSDSPTSYWSSGPLGGVPGMFLPFLSYSPLWHGQKNLFGLPSSHAQLTVQPRCLQIGESAMRLSPSL